jgi:hypothetical protein
MVSTRPTLRYLRDFICSGGGRRSWRMERGDWELVEIVRKAAGLFSHLDFKFHCVTLCLSTFHLFYFILN